MLDRRDYRRALNTMFLPGSVLVVTWVVLLVWLFESWLA
jgi:hypothetical protein